MASILKKRFSGRIKSFFLMGFLLLNAWLFSQEISIPPNPNHYILLIDSSGSTASNDREYREYRDALTIALMNQLYRDGFGKAIPPFSPNDDMLTVLFFGVVPQHYNPPHLYFKNYNLTTDFIHIAMVRQRRINESDLKNSICPGQFFKLTILTWAKNLALNSLLKDKYKFHGSCSRVFLIMVHDGIINGNTIREEINFVERWSNEKLLPTVKDAVDKIDKDYIFTDGCNRSGSAWTKQIGGKNEIGEPIFLEAYEILSRKQQKWESDLDALVPFSDTSFSWKRERGINPAGILEVFIDRKFLDFFKSSKTSTFLSFTCNNDKERDKIELGNRLVLPVVLSTPLACRPLLCRAGLEISIQCPDDLLGMRSIHYMVDKEMSTPLPARCTTAYYIKWGTFLAGILLFLAMVSWFIYYRAYSTHIKIKFPGLSFPIDIKRGRNITASTPVHPFKSIPAFSLRLPAPWKQFVLYRKMEISLICSDINYLYWLAGSKETTSIRLPAGCRRIDAWWNSVPLEPDSVVVTFLQGNKKSEARIYFPAGIAGGLL
ncbi:MAG: hypothetical protein L0Y73_08775 [Candidatus Aminicenantes bacterium]|nr:hypothetical protein [Candidatus Aminicenantes bacterium]